jgi:hypothetical protein
MRRHALFIGVFVVVAAAWFVILLASQTHVHSDEAIIGLMAKHISEGRYFPFYMYGQPYNAGAAWEAYVAAVVFAAFGVSVISLKGSILVLSLLCLFLFYRMGCVLYDVRTAVLATVAFALSPSLLKWHFQVRGYSWYFVSIPILVILFGLIESDQAPKKTRLFLFGLASGISIWCLELAIPIVGALWLLLLLRRRFSLAGAASGLVGFLAGYAPVIAFNFANHFSNWRYLIVERPGGGFSSLLNPSAIGRIFLDEMPKFFGPDTVLWYYPETPASGYVFYTIAFLAVVTAIGSFAKSPSKIMHAFRGDLLDNAQKRDFDMLVLTAASFVPYLTQPVGVPSYFFGGTFFLSVLTGRMLERSFSSSSALRRLAGVGVLAAISVTGVLVMITVGQKNQIETLTLCNDGKNYRMTRIPGPDLEGVEQYLRQHGVTSVWTTISFVHPLLFETGETVAVSNAIFDDPLRIYPSKIPWREPRLDRDAVFVIEADAPFRSLLEAHCARAFGAPPLVEEHGKLAVVAEHE